jgi:hypothetical protein
MPGNGNDIHRLTTSRPLKKANSLKGEDAKPPV